MPIRFSLSRISERRRAFARSDSQSGRQPTAQINGDFRSSGGRVEQPDRAVANSRARHDNISLLSLDSARQSAQGFTAAREPRTDSSDGDIENRCDFSVAHSLQADEQDYRTLRTGEFGDSALEIAQLQSVSLLRCSGQQRLAFTQADRPSFPGCSPDVVDVLVVKYCE